MPQNPCIIATKTPSSDVLVFDYTKHPSKPGKIALLRNQIFMNDTTFTTSTGSHFSSDKEISSLLIDLIFFFRPKWWVQSRP